MSTTLCKTQPKIFATNKIFSAFPNEIAKTKLKALWRENGATAPASIFDGGREKDEVYVATTFGICVGLLRQQKVSEDGFLKSEKFQEIVDAINSIRLGKGHEREESGEENGGTSLTPKSSRIKNLEGQLSAYHLRAAELIGTPPPTPSTVNNSGKPSHVDIEEAGLSEAADLEIGPIIKRKVVSRKCNNIMESLKETASPDSFGSFVGHSILFDAEKSFEFLNTELSEAIDISAKKYDPHKSLVKLVGENVIAKQTTALRVPDWVQLLVKIKTKLPDDGWQTILNYLNLGRSGVSKLIF